MRLGKLYILIAIILPLGCSQRGDKDSSTIKQTEIEELVTVEDKRDFLEEILKQDQAVRNGQKEAELISKYGHDSNEHMDFIKKQWKQDEINLQKIEAYLGKYGYPKKDELGKDAAIAPWIVIHHSTDAEIRNRNFKTFYRAYLTGDIDDAAMSMYLGRTYEFTFKERFRMESPYKSEDEINLLIEKLGLEEKKTNDQAGIIE